MQDEIKKRAALLISIKEEGKGVSFEHILEKVSRDVSFHGAKLRNEDLINALNELISSGYASFENGLYYPTAKTESYVMQIMREEWEEMNLSYRLVFTAIKYYNHVSELILPFLQSRPVTVVKIFSGKKDPIRELDVIFSRYKKYKPAKVYHRINSREDLMSYVYDHCIDFIPYVHREGSHFPDWLVVDLDAGEGILELKNSAEIIKFVISLAYELLERIGVRPMIKFSGSRGYQLWIGLRNGSSQDAFLSCRKFIALLQQRVEQAVRKRFNEAGELFEGLHLNHNELTTSRQLEKEQRKYMILFDYSSMKQSGDVRAPYSLNYKTGLASLPLSIKELESFVPERDANPFNIITRKLASVELEQYSLDSMLDSIEKLSV